MKNWIITLLLIGIGLSAKADDFELKLAEFRSIKAQGNYKVILEKGETNTAKIENHDNDVDDDKIIVEVVNDELRVRLKGDTYKERDVVITITYIKLDKVIAKMGCELEVKGVMDVDNIEFNSDSGGKIKASVNSKRVRTKISAGGSIHLDGTTEKAFYAVSAGGTLGAVSLSAKMVVAEVTAGGEIICSVIDDLAIKITSGGNVSYMGDPEAYEQKITLGGKIAKMKSPTK